MKFTCNACNMAQPCVYTMPEWTHEDHVYPECPLCARSDWRYEGMPDDAPPVYKWVDPVAIVEETTRKAVEVQQAVKDGQMELI